MSERDARPVYVFRLWAPRLTYHIGRYGPTYGVTLCGIRTWDQERGRMLGTAMRRDHARELGHLCGRCWKLEAA